MTNTRWRGSAHEDTYGMFDRNTILFIVLHAWLAACGESGNSAVTLEQGGIVRADTSRRTLALVFTGDAYADGGEHIRSTLRQSGIPASFFFTGNFYRNSSFAPLIEGLAEDGHYLGAHSDRHLLYCAWENRDSMLVTRSEFEQDVRDNYREMARYGIRKEDAPYFLPAYEWYNAAISGWTRDLDLILVNFTPGTGSNADYTTPDMGVRYRSSAEILNGILAYESDDVHGLNGFILLLHIGTAPERTDKFYMRLDTLLTVLLDRDYAFRRIDRLLDGTL